MANIKFSQFTVGNTESDIDFVVGYKGANNIQISPTNLLAASLSGYLPLAGGTMTGDVIFNDNIRAKFGTGGDLNVYHDGSNSRIQNITGDIRIINFADDKDIIFQSDDGSGGVTEYITLDGSATQTKFSLDTKHVDDAKAKFGDSNDLEIYHDATNTWLDNFTGNLNIRNQQNSGDIIFRCDNGNGGVAEYIRLDGSATTTIFSKNTRYADNVELRLGSGSDFKAYHSGTNTVLENETGDLYIKNNFQDRDIIFQSDNGGGGIATYFQLDGSRADLNYTYTTRPDGGVITFGGNLDLRIWRDPIVNKSYIRNYNDDFIIESYADDKDIIFNCDDGSGGVTEYFRLDGSSVRTLFSRNTQHVDNSKAIFGNGDDFQIVHNGTDTQLNNLTGNLQFTQLADDKDISFASDNGSGGDTIYFYLDGSLADGTNVFTKFGDNSWITMGNGGDLLIGHQTTSSKIENYTGPLYIVNKANDQDIIFQSDDGSGGVTEYFRVDGSNTNMVASKTIVFNDNSKASFGNSEDLKLFHNGTDSFIINETGNLKIVNGANDKDIIFESDDGSGGVTEYFKLWGLISSILISKDVLIGNDTAKLKFGASQDLEIYHDGSNSYISERGTGRLIISGGSDVQIQAPSGELMADFNGNNSVDLYYDNSKKLETTSTGIKITGVSEYADNTAAIAGGLTTGDVYRTGDLLKIVH